MKIFDESGIPSKEFYLFLKHNKIFDKDNLQLTSYEEELYLEFCRLYSEFVVSFGEGNSNKSSTIFGNMSSMFGFSRHYCSVSGSPIIGNYYKIGGRIVGKDAYDSYMIIQEMEKRHLPKEKTSKNIPNKPKVKK